MCGRYTVRRIDSLRSIFDARTSSKFDEFSEIRRSGLQGLFNIAPSMQIPVVRLNSKGERVLDLIRWGLIPSWTKEKPKSQPCNARAETLATSGMFRQALERRRCLVPADGFYEWQGAKPPKQPYFIHRPDDRPFAFAGLWERWKPDAETDPIDTCTIITTSPNELMAPIHNRMPVVLDESEYERWLDRGQQPDEIEKLLNPYDGELQADPVSTRVNNVRNDGPELVEPVK